MGTIIKEIIRKRKTPYRLINNECIIANLENHNLIILNEVGGMVWEGLIKEKNYVRFLQNLKDKFSDVPSDFEESIIAIIKELEKEGFVELK